MTTGARVGVTMGLVASAILGVAMVGLFVVDAMDSASGCGSVDPTDPANYSRVMIVNDTSREIVLDACAGDYCHADVLPASVAPGQTFQDDAACGTSGSDMTSWRVRLPDGTLIGYIAVASPKSQSGLKYDVSTASPSRSMPTPLAVRRD